jgi:hypothetical protein
MITHDTKEKAKQREKERLERSRQLARLAELEREQEQLKLKLRKQGQLTIFDAGKVKRLTDFGHFGGKKKEINGLPPYPKRKGKAGYYPAGTFWYRVWIEEYNKEGGCLDFTEWVDELKRLRRQQLGRRN